MSCYVATMNSKSKDGFLKSYLKTDLLVKCIVLISPEEDNFIITITPKNAKGREDLERAFEEGFLKSQDWTHLFETDS